MLFSSFGWSSVIIVHLCLKSGEFGSGSMVRFGDGGGGCAAGKLSFLFWIPVEIVYIHRLQFSSSFEHNLKNMW